MTIKWVLTDPLVMNGEPFCYGTRLTVRNILELRSNTTVVWIPPLHYPHGYGAKADGARVISAPGASRLVLRTRPGVHTVTLVVVR